MCLDMKLNNLPQFKVTQLNIMSLKYYPTSTSIFI